jgi:hypothetical protein
LFEWLYGNEDVPSGAEVVVLEVIVVHFAGVEQCGRCVGGIKGMGVDVGVVRITFRYSSGGVGKTRNMCLFTCYGPLNRDNSTEMVGK